MITTLVVLFVVGLGAVLALALIIGLIALAVNLTFALGFFLVFKVAPVLILGYFVVRFLAPRHRRRLDSHDYEYDRIAG